MSERESDGFLIRVGEGPLVAELPFSNREYERRLENLRSDMRQKGIDVFVSFGPENIFYLTGHDTPAYQYTQACVVTHTMAPINVLRSIDASNTFQCSWSRQAVVYEDNHNPVSAIHALICEISGPDASIGLENEAFFITPHRYSDLTRRLAARGHEIVEGHLVEQRRLVKSNEELAHIGNAARITERAMASAIAASGEGVNENEIAAQTWATLVRNGGQFPGLPPFIVSGRRTSMAHATWSGGILHAGDPLAFEIPGVVNRYVAPMFRSGSVGAPSKELERLAAACTSSLEILVSALKPGVTAEELHRLHVENFKRQGLHVGHRSGYSVGVNYAPDWGEGNSLSIMAGEKRELVAGMVFHFVPGVYVPNVCAVVVSDTVAVTPNGCELVTHFPRDFFVV